MSGSAYYLYWLTRNPQFVREKAGFYGRITQPGVKRPGVNQDQDNAQE